LAVPGFVAANAVALASAPWLPVSLLLPLAYVLALSAISLQIVLQRRSRCGLLAGAAALVMHVAWALGFAEGMVTFRERRWVPALPSAQGIGEHAPAA
jgi:succinoglycan biosynthesis protein ExoA